MKNRLGFVYFGILIASFATAKAEFPGPSTSANGDHASLPLRLVSHLGAVVSSDAAIFVGRYKTDRYQVSLPRPDGTSPGVPAFISRTGVARTGSQEFLRFAGDFRLVAQINSTPPELGRIDGSVGVNTLWGGDAAWGRLSALVAPKVIVSSPTEADSVLFIAIGTQGKPILDFSFVGPLSSEQQKPAEAFARYLCQHPMSKLTRQLALQLLSDDDQCKVLEGLLWLENANSSVPLQYLDAACAAAPDEAGDIIRRMFQQAVGREEFQREIGPAFGKLLEKRSEGVVANTLAAVEGELAHANVNTVRAVKGHADSIVVQVDSTIKSLEGRPKTADRARLLATLRSISDSVTDVGRSSR